MVVPSRSFEGLGEEEEGKGISSAASSTDTSGTCAMMIQSKREGKREGKRDRERERGGAK